MVFFDREVNKCGSKGTGAVLCLQKIKAIELLYCQHVPFYNDFKSQNFGFNW